MSKPFTLHQTQNYIALRGGSMRGQLSIYTNSGWVKLATPCRDMRRFLSGLEPIGQWGISEMDCSRSHYQFRVDRPGMLGDILHHIMAFNDD